MNLDENSDLHWNELSWNPIRPDLTGEIVGHSLIPDGATVQNIALTRVAPNGEFPTHTDDYHHVFCFIQGEGEAWSGQSRYQIEPEKIVRVTAGTPHGYRNTGCEDMMLITINYY
ncbi:cupin domain-containing protein [Candidatus Thorarchaeota archaeon]|jgi:quercetin dioxygenase-like cupin family protein|nr:MAG: cupin domain-containing protein [Candidatus Thorarchaeota archaeon]